jgi:G:T-mismatch repair DNA endonuclease (very short patch repair protein)
MRESQRKRDPSTYHGGGADPAVLSELRRQEWARRTPEQKQRHLHAFIAAGQIHNKKSSKTAIEATVGGMLNALGIPFRQNVQIGRYNVDFLVGRTIIECFGDFWHCNPSLWAEGDFNKSLHLTAREKWEKDRDRQAKLEAMGYRFVSFWESDLRNAPELIQCHLKTFRWKDDDNAAQE